MALFRSIRTLYERLFERQKRDAELDAEIKGYFAMVTDRYMARGLSKDEAQRAARVAFEGSEQVKQKVREARMGATLEATLKDIRYAARMMKKSPAFSALIIVMLALGIGANTAVFSIVDAVLLRPLPFHDPSRLVLIFDAVVRDKEAKIFVPYPDFEQWAAKNRSYATMAASTWIRGPRFLLGRGAPQSILAVLVSRDFFSMLGVPAQLGRTFAPDDVSRACSVVVSHSFWRSHLGSHANAVGQHLTLEDSSCTVVGVMPPSFTFYPAPTDMWMLITPATKMEGNKEFNGVAVYGRLKPGVSAGSAVAELNAIVHATDHGRRYGIEVQPVSFNLQQEFTWLSGQNLRLSVLVLFGAVSLVLLIACVNVANLLLSRSLVRQRELAIRAALGSSRARLLRQLLTESLMLSIAGSTLAVAIAEGVVYAFKILNPVQLPPGATLSVNIPVLLFTLGLALGTTMVFGFVPAWRGSELAYGEALKSGGRHSAGPSGQLFARCLIAAEISFSVVLLAGAGLFIQSIEKFASAPLGFMQDRLMMMTMNLPPHSYPKAEQQMAFYDQIERRLRTMPGVEGVGMSSHIGLKGGTGVSALTIKGRPPVDPKNYALDTQQQFVTPRYFRFMGVTVEQGREFDWTDRGQTLTVAVVNRALVRKYFPHQEPIGKHIRFAGPQDQNPWMTIVGIVGDERQNSPFQEMMWTEPPILYRPLAQQPSPSVDLIVRVVSPKIVRGAAIEHAVLQADPDVRISDVYPIEHLLNHLTAYPRFRAVLMASFAGLALLLAVVGLYGVLSQLVVQRTQEIGIRVALGAQVSDVLQLVMKQGIALAVIGAALGLGVALLLGRFVGSLLYGIEAQDPMTLGGVAAILVFAAAIATYVPARRASRVDPMEALRAE